MLLGESTSVFKPRDGKAARLQTTKTDGVECELWFETDGLPERCAIVKGAVGDHGLHFARVVDVVQRIRAEDDYVRAHAGRDRADFLIETHHLCRNRCCCLNRFHGREAGLDVEFHFAM